MLHFLMWSILFVIYTRFITYNSINTVQYIFFVILWPETLMYTGKHLHTYICTMSSTSEPWIRAPQEDFCVAKF